MFTKEYNKILKEVEKRIEESLIVQRELEAGIKKLEEKVLSLEEKIK